MSGTLCLVGGTFDCFHQGHQSLLEAAFSCDRVEIWVSSDAIALAKDPRIKPQSERFEVHLRLVWVTPTFIAQP